MDSDDEIIHIKRSEYERLKARDRNYSDDLYCHMSTKPFICVVRTEYERITDKAQKWDEWCNTKPGRDVNEWKDKAKKWDSLLVKLDRANLLEQLKKFIDQE